IGLDAVRRITYRTTRNEATRCNFCKNNCLRTFIDIKMAVSPAHTPAADVAAKKPSIIPLALAPAKPVAAESASKPAAKSSAEAAPVKFVSKVAKADDEQRLIIATCEKGTVEDVDAMRGIKAGLDKVKKANPNFVEIAAAEVWKPRKPE